ncbi:MAG: hypothetical protein BKP49_05910 [Treponema sp. CETP13]|nr:MAG: hypothetical protein BKP49_05910 [Treponema sp. CETP13]
MINIKNCILYYGFSKEEYHSVEQVIDKGNFRSGRSLAFLMTLLLVFHSLSTFFIHHYDIYHFYTFTGFLIGSILIVFFLYHPHIKRYVLATKIMLIVMYAYGIFIGTVNTSQSNAVTIVVFLVLLPCMNNNRFIETFLLEIVASVIFLLLCAYYKTGIYFRNDVVNVLSFIFVGILFHYMLSRNVIKGKLFQLENEKVLKELRLAKDLAEAAADAKESFLANMSHDIRTPLNAILGLTQLALTKVNNPEGVDYFKRIQNSGNYLLGVLNDILDMSKIQSGKVNILLDTVNFKEMIDGILEIIEPKAEKKNIHIRVKVSGNVSKYQKIDKVHVMQILVNLLSNSVKYTQPSGIVIFSIEQVIHDTGDSFVRYTIEDNGIGMSIDFMSHLYEVFKREKNEFASSEEGTGLGLSIAKKLVDYMGGTIYCTSELEIGTTFVVELPLNKISTTSFRKGTFAEESKNNLDRLQGGNLKILLVEDNPINSEIVIQLLKTRGFEVVHCEDGQQAVDYIANNDNSEMFLILMDTQMPILNGLEATKAIRNLPSLYAKKIPIVGLSANAFTEDRQKAVAVGMNDYLTKPIVAKDLFETISKFI